MNNSLARDPHRLKAFTLSTVLLWFLLALGGSLSGVFDSQHRPPIPLGVAAILPVAVFVVWYVSSNEFRQLILATNLRLLVMAQTWRVAGIVFLILYWRGMLPGVFALPAGWGDIAIGATAPLAAQAVSSGKHLRWFVLWNIVGIVDLVLAVTLGVLSSATPVGVLAGEVTTEVMGRFPLSLIPTFLVPLFLIFHLIGLSQSIRSAVTQQA